MLLPVILHPDVTDFLRTEFQKNLKDSISTWKCIDKVRQQDFDGGLRVKKLRGISKRVWEARITRATRLIFTYERSIDPDTKQSQVYVAIQDICLDHDDVSRRAKARTRTPDARWLDAEEVRAIGSVEIDCDTLSGDEQSALLEAIGEELQILENITDELLGNIQWQVLDSELDWHKAIVEQDENLPLRLSVEESDLVNHYGNLLVSGSAGTGKTTVGLYQLLKSLERFSSGKRLYVAYNPILVKETSKQFARLVGSKITEIESWFQFQTIQDLCSQILFQAGKTYSEYDEVDYQSFERIYSRQPTSKKYPPALVWDEIRSIIKGSYLKTDRRLFSLPEYKDLGRNQSSVITQQERPDIYRIAQWYQTYLKNKKRFDEIDLARLALKYIRQGQQERYQMIVCDEVQDLTELQLHLLMQLITPDGHLFFAGDLNQMISPSGFRWEDLKSLFYNSDRYCRNNRQVIEKKLQFNFRSVSSLVRLANQLLILRSRLLSENIDDGDRLDCQSSESVLLEKSARLINAPIENIEPIVKQLYSGDAVLVRTQEQKEEISQRLDSSLVFTIEEAKGLEFDTVFLVEFFLPHQALWQKAINGIPALKDKEIPQLRLELNLLYVAITRARRILNVWEDRLSVVWNQPELVDLVQSIIAESVRKERLESTVEMWQERGIYYFDAKRYRQAVECFKNSGDVKLKWQAIAKLALQEEKYNKAANFFVRLEDWQQAAQHYEKATQWSQAAIYWSKSGNTHKQQTCEAEALEAERKWEEAALSWEAIAQKWKPEKPKDSYSEKAEDCWLESDNEPKKIKVRKTRAKRFENKEEWLNAAEQYRLAKLPQDVARCSAKAFENKKQWQKAAQQYRLAKLPQDAARCQAEDFEIKQQLKEAAQQWQKAAQQYELARMPRSAIRCIARSFEANKEWTKAAEQYKRIEMPQEVARCKAKDFETKKQWQQAAKQWHKAAEQYEQAKMPAKAARCRAKNFEIKQQWQKAAKQYRLAKMTPEAARCSAKDFESKKQWQKAAEQWKKAAEQYERANMPRNAARCRAKEFEIKQQWQKAAKQYRLAKMPQDAARCQAEEFKIKQQWKKAAEQYTQARMLQDAARCKAKEFEIKQQWQEAAEQYKRAGMAEKAAKLLEKAKQAKKSRKPISSKKIGYQTIADVNAAMPKTETIDILGDLSFFKSKSIWGDPEVEMSRLEKILPTFDNIIDNKEYGKKCQVLIDNKGKGDKDLYTMCFWHLHAFAWSIKIYSHEYDFTASDFLRSQVGELSVMAKENDNYDSFLFGLNNYVRIANEYTNSGAVILCNLQSETGFMIPDWIEH